MRLLFPDKRWASAVNEGFVDVTAVGPPTADGDMRDYWIRFLSAADSNNLQISLHKTQDDARDDVRAIGTIDTTLGSVATLSVTNLPGEKPSTAGATLTVDTSTATNEQILAVWGYTAAPAVVLMDEIHSVLEEYQGEGQALEKYSGATDVGEQGRQHFPAAIWLTSSGREAALDFDNRHRKGFLFSITVTVVRADWVAALDDEGLLQMLQRELLQDMGAVASILLDERRYLDGNFALAGRCQKLLDWGAPAPLEEPFQAYFGASLTVGYQLHNLRSDYKES